jgi:hypothetical protein
MCKNEDSPKAMRLSRDGFFVPRNLSVGTVLDVPMNSYIIRYKYNANFEVALRDLLIRFGILDRKAEEIPIV